MKWLGVGACVVAAVCAPTVAWACNCVETPRCEAVTVAGEEVPANSDGLVWLPSWPVTSQQEAEDVLVFERVEPDGTSAAVPFVWRVDPNLYGARIAPVGGFEEGARYRTRLRMAELRKACSSAVVFDGPSREEPVEAEPVEFTVSAPVEALELGVEVGPVERGEMPFTESGGCVQETDATSVTVRIEEPEAVAAMGAQVVYSLFVDDALYTYHHDACQRRQPYGALGADRLEAKVVASCKELSSALVLDDGVHTIEVRARLMGTNTVFSSQTFTVDMSCEELPLGGCAQGGGRAPAPLGWLGLSVALGWFVRRRR